MNASFQTFASTWTCHSKHSSTCIEKMKIETAIQLARDNKKFELDVLQATQAFQEHVAALFADVIRSQHTRKDHVAK